MGIEHHGGGYMKLAKRKLFIPLDLQFFADDGDGGQGDTGTGDAGTGNQGKGSDCGDDGNKQPSFDDFLKDKAMQSEFDKRIAKALETAKVKWETAKAKELEDAKTEAEKLAKMNADQKAEYEKKKAEEDFNKRLADLNMRELKATAKETLASEGLPLELAEVLNYTDADSCNKSIEAVKTAFQTAVSKAVNEKLKGKGVPKAGAGSSDSFDAQLRASMGLPPQK